MAFGIKRQELLQWKKEVQKGNIAFLTHYWLHPKFPSIKSVTKVGCNDLHTLISWGKKYDLKEEWIHYREKYPHFDLIGKRQYQILKNEKKFDHIEKFKLKE